MLIMVNYNNEQWYVLPDEDNQMTYVVYYKNNSFIGYMAYIVTIHLGAVLNHNTVESFCYMQNTTNYKYIESLINKEMEQ
jgi:hypothetical protein